MLKFYDKFLCDGLGAVRQTVLYADRSCIKYLLTFTIVGTCSNPNNTTVDSRYLDFGYLE